MNFIDISYPTWSVLLAVLVAIILAGVLYFRTTFEDRKPLTILLYVLRSLGILLILLLLLNPFLSRSQNEEQPARLLFLQDNTQSLFFDQDSQELFTYHDRLTNFLNETASHFPVETYQFDQSVQPYDPVNSTFDGQITNINDALKYTDEMHQADHIGALIIATDGIYNRGANPAYFRARGDYPVFVLALGDTTPAQDVRIQQVLYNEIVRKNETSEIQVDVTGNFNQETPAELSLQLMTNNSWRTIDRKTIHPENRSDFFETVTFHKKYENPGVERLRVLVSGITNDLHPQNNVREFFVEVLETARQIQIVSTFPHPDLGAIREILAENENNEVGVTLVERPADLPDPSSFNILIFYQLPNVSFLLDYIKEAKAANKGIILTAGLQTNFQAFNQIQNLVSISPKTITGNLFNTWVNPQFDLFEVDQEFKQYISKYPPLAGVFGEYVSKGQGQALLLQKIGDVETESPIVYTGIEDGSRMSILTVEGFWKWKLFEFLEKQETPVLNKLFDNIVEYVSQKKDDRLFRLQKNKLLFDETEEITFQAELYNETLERITDPDVFFELQDSLGNRSEFTFDKTNSGYKLNLGRMTPGNYTYRAHTATGGENYEENGQFSVRRINMEAYNLEANHSDMNTMAIQNKGKLFYDFDALQTHLKSLPTMKPILIQSHVKSAMIDWKWIFGVILCIFTLEWVLRRYFGSY